MKLYKKKVSSDSASMYNLWKRACSYWNLEKHMDNLHEVMDLKSLNNVEHAAKGLQDSKGWRCTFEMNIKPQEKGWGLNWKILMF